MTAGLWSLPFIPPSSGISRSFTYDGVAAWLEGKPGNHRSEASKRTLQKIANSAELQSQLRLQDATAALLRQRRHDAGALTFHTAELQPVLAVRPAWPTRNST